MQSGARAPTREELADRDWYSGFQPLHRHVAPLFTNHLGVRVAQHPAIRVEQAKEIRIAAGAIEDFLQPADGFDGGGSSRQITPHQSGYDHRLSLRRTGLTQQQLLLNAAQDRVTADETDGESGNDDQNQQTQEPSDFVSMWGR